MSPPANRRRPLPMRMGTKSLGLPPLKLRAESPTLMRTTEVPARPQKFDRLQIELPPILPKQPTMYSGRLHSPAPRSNSVHPPAHRTSGIPSAHQRNRPMRPVARCNASTAESVDRKSISWGNEKRSACRSSRTSCKSDSRAWDCPRVQVEACRERSQDTRRHASWEQIPCCHCSLDDPTKPRLTR